MNYRLAYAIDFHPWEDLAEHPPFAGKLLELVAREENGREAPYGPALDLGTGSAVWGVELAKRGWRVTGIDIVEKALQRARRRIQEAGVEMRLVHGDVTALRDEGVGSGFRLVLDTGTFHDLSEAQREAMGREVSARRRAARRADPRLLHPPAPGAAASRREPGRRGTGLPRVGGHRRRGRGHRARPARARLQVRRALLPPAPRRERGMSLAYRLLYLVGFTPWEQMARWPVARQITTLFEHEEAGRQPPYGPALDLGCGSGIWAVELAKRGWQVTGVDFVPRALRRARKRAADAGVDARFVEGDVTALGAAGIGAGFRLLLDFGCFHDELTDGQRAAEGREATAVASPGATLLIGAWKPGRRGPLPRGASREDVERAFPVWELIEEHPADVHGAPGYVRRADPRMYRLRRKGGHTP